MISRSRKLVGLSLWVLLSACTKAPDLSAVDTERAKSLQRYDIIQSLAANEQVLVAGTQSGAVLASKDSGKTWTRQVLGQASLIGLAVCPDGSFVGIDFYHKVWMGDATGTKWKASTLDKPHAPLAVTCDALNRWHVTGSGAKFARSSDQGANWLVADLKEDIQITAVQMIDENRGIALGEFGLVAKTEDGGATWKKGPAIPGEFYPYAVLFVDGKEGYASGIAGTILRTQDGGGTWVKIENRAQTPLYRLFLHAGKPHGVGGGGIVARLEGDSFRPVAYPDAAPVFLGAGASVPGLSALAIGGPGGLVRVIGTQVN